MLRQARPLLMSLAAALLCACPDPGAQSEDAGPGGNNGSGSSSGGGHSGGTSGVTSQGGGGSSTAQGSSAGGGGSSQAAQSGATSGAVSGGASGAGSSTAGNPSSGLTASSSTQTMMGTTYIWAHTPKDLYRVDSTTLEATRLGTLTFLDENNQELPNAQLTDMAVAGNGAMWGCSQRVLWQIDAPSLTAYKRADLEEAYTGLTFVPVGFLEQDREVLVGATQSDGALYRIDLVSGATTQIGSYGSGWQTSGDIVAVLGDGMYATVKRTGESTDYLARVDPATGVATIIGPTGGIGALKTYGLGYWNSVLYAFTDDGQMYAVDKQTGAGTLLNTRQLRWWGAGVTTLAKVN